MDCTIYRINNRKKRENQWPKGQLWDRMLEVPALKMGQYNLSYVRPTIGGLGRCCRESLPARRQSKSMYGEIGGCPNRRVSNVIVVAGNNARLQSITEVS